jgi:hypothetical protein
MERRDFIRVLGGGAALGLAGGLILNGPVEAQPPGRRGRNGSKRKWVLLGEQRVSFRTENDVIRVSRKEGRFRAIGLDARGADVHVRALTVYFRDRSSARIRLDEVVREDGRSRVVDLPGRPRAISHVDVVYRAVGRRRSRHATLRLYGIE